ncbi:CTP--phosphocholine cytidylyltransferase [Synergistales bacterium]|nr:CTP--phosphocholine cytidylyltransferase [Synergistales bacterium]
MAAGVGERMYPITRATPKPLLHVNGVRMIDTIVDGLLANNIREIYIAVGYLKEKFVQWLSDRRAVGLDAKITLIENPYYDNCNNISSLYVSREHLSNCVILDGDQVLVNQDILSPRFARSGYCCVWTEKETNEWLLTIDKATETILSCDRNGGNHGWQLYSVSFWTAEDGQRLQRHLELEFEQKKNRDIYWDDVAIFRYFSEYKLGIRKIKSGDILELDTIEELQTIDSRYKNYEGNKNV